jgi:CheY-like chemotaxis protein
LDLARVLLVHGDLAPRLALQTILQAGGYSVEVAATPSEAIAKLDEGKYDLVLSDTEFGSRPAGRNLLAYARVKDYRPATALVTSFEPELKYRAARRRHKISIHTENLASLLSDVAELIGLRACRRYRPLGPAY